MRADRDARENITQHHRQAKTLTDNDNGGADRHDDRQILENQALIGGDPLPFGLEANRPTFQALIDYAYSQQIIPERVQPEDVLAPNALEP